MVTCGSAVLMTNVTSYATELKNGYRYGCIMSGQGFGMRCSPPFMGKRYSLSVLCSTRQNYTPQGNTKPKLKYRGELARMLSGSDGSETAMMQTLQDGAVNRDTPLVLSQMESTLPPPPPISKADDAFLEEGIEFVWGTDGLGIEELNNLFEKVGFPRRDPSRLSVALVNTHTCLWVRAARKSRLAKEGQLLGFARATSDGALSATIWDVAVLPSWQRGGIGRGLVERLTASLVMDGIPTVTLYAEPGVVGLYEKLGFVKDPMSVKGMAFQSKSERGKELVASIGA